MALRKQPAEDLDVDQLAEAELSKLQRQYRIKEGGRQAYSQEANTLLQRQRRMIKTLDAERREQLTNLQLAKSSHNELKDNKMCMKVTELLNLTDKYDAEIKSEKMQLSELNWQIKKVEKEVLDLKKQSMSDSVIQQKGIKTQRNITNLENRLGVVTAKFNMMITANGKLREEINHLWKERAQFNRLYQQLVNHLNRGKKIMVDLIEQATLAYDQREEAQNKLEALRNRGKADLRIQSQEMRELQRRLDHDIKLQEFLGVKGQRRIMADLEAREALRRKKKREATEHLIDTYEGILKQIKEFSGEQDIDRLAAQFVKQEEENFAIFNYVNELNNEVESLTDQVTELRTKIDEQQDLNKKRALEQEDTLSQLTNTYTEKKRMADESQDKLDECNHVMHKLLEGIEHIFHLVRCDNAPILSLLGDNTHVTSYNVMLYLGIIERRTNDLMNVVFSMEQSIPIEELAGMQRVIKDEPPLKPWPIPIEKIVPTQPCSLCVEQAEITEVEEEKFQPLSNPDVETHIRKLLEDPESSLEERLHSTSTCRMPHSRKIMQKRYE